MSNNEIALIEETKSHLRDRDSDKALNFLTDKVFMYKLGSSYAYSYAQEIRWVNILKKSELGRKILQRFYNLEEVIEKAKEFMSLKEIKNTGESFLKGYTSYQDPIIHPDDPIEPN